MKDYPALVVRPSRSGSDFGDLLAATLDDFDVVALEEIEDGAAWRAFFSSIERRDAAARAVAMAFPDASTAVADVSDEDWAARSQAALKAVRVGGITVAPPWDLPQGDDSTVVILPSMGFGTGHHATTRLCLKALQDERPMRKSVIDVGTGSGVLALAAARLGARRVRGFDNDPDAIFNALENKDLNALDVEFRCEGIEGPAGEVFDIVLANLTGAVLIRYAAALIAFTAPGGRLILSGLREEEEQDVLGAFGRAVHARTSEDGWVCLTI